MSGYPPSPRTVGVYGGPRGAYFQPRTVYYPPSPRLSLQLVTLDPIFPAPVRDFRQLSFAALIGQSPATIVEASWGIATAPATQVDDFDPETRLIGPPTIDMPAMQSTTQLVGDMIDGVEYILTATVTLTDNRILVMRGSLTCIAQSLYPPVLPPGAVPFDYQYWLTLFPEFKSISPEQANAFWSMACEILRNDRTSPVTDPEERRDILMLLTAHIAALFGGPQGGGGFSPTMTGVITSKSVNGVSIGSSGIFPGVSGTQAWYMTSKYGQLAWMKLRAYRSFYYVAGPQRDLISPWTSWPWKIGGAGGWGAGNWGTGAIVSIPGPPGPPGPPGRPGGMQRVYTDETTISGDGATPETALQVDMRWDTGVDPTGAPRPRIRRPRG